MSEYIDYIPTFILVSLIYLAYKTLRSTPIILLYISSTSTSDILPGPVSVMGQIPASYEYQELQQQLAVTEQLGREIWYDIEQKRYNMEQMRYNMEQMGYDTERALQQRCDKIQQRIAAAKQLAMETRFQIECYERGIRQLGGDPIKILGTSEAYLAGFRY